MQKTYAALKKRTRLPDNRLFLSPVSAGHIFAESRNDAMKAFVVEGAGSTLEEEEPDGVSKPYFAFLLKEGFPTLDEEPSVTPTAQATPVAASPTVVDVVDNA